MKLLPSQSRRSPPKSTIMTTMAFSSSPLLHTKPVPTLSTKKHLTQQNPSQVLSFSTPNGTHSPFLVRSADNGSGVVVEEKKEEVKKVEPLGSNRNLVEAVEVPRFKDARWVAGTWDLEQFKKGGVTDWDAVIDAEVRRRKWLQDHPETSSNDDPVVFDSSIIPWWSWVKRFHLPEAELLNGRAAMVGFFMAYFVDSLTGVGLVDQIGNFFCKTLLFVAVLGVLFIRKNEDVETLKKLFEETTFYDKQWQATWQGDSTSASIKE